MMEFRKNQAVAMFKQAKTLEDFVRAQTMYNFADATIGTITTQG